jgi:hypothetical protein
MSADLRRYNQPPCTGSLSDSGSWLAPRSASSSFGGIDGSIGRRRLRSILKSVRRPFIPGIRNIYQEHAPTAYKLDNATPWPVAGPGTVCGD